MLELGVDEITLVLQIPSVNKNVLSASDWKDVAEYMISRFEKQSDIKAVFGNRDIEQKAPAGYTIAYKYGEHDFYFAIAYHDYQISMGVVVKFSAQSLDYYLETTDLKVYEFLQKVSHKDYKQRLSRIDLTADYIDEDIDISNIYQSLMDSKVAIFREQFNARIGKVEYRKVPMKYKGIIDGQEVGTIYVGSEKSNSRLRIYDKRFEQIQHKGNKLEKALKCNNWVRFEGVFRNEYAHQLSGALMKLKNDDEFGNLIASTIYQKYLFMEVDNGVASVPTEYTQMLIDCVNNNSFKLRASLTRNYELARNIAYIFNGSGVMNTIYKLKEIWGLDSVMWLMEYILEAIQSDFKPNEDCRYWLLHNVEDYRKYYPEFDDFIKSNLIQIL